MRNPTRPRRRRPLALLVLCVLGPLALRPGTTPGSAQEIDTFHLRLYQDGAELAAAGQFDEAVALLRLACFGMLERPKALAPCLGRLLAAQESADAPEDEMEATVDRLLEVERRFRGWSEPDSRFALSDELRRRVVALFGRFGTAESLARVPGLGDVALEKQAQRVAQMPTDERRRELNLLVQRQARVPIWHVMSAELALEEGDPRAAAAAAREILATFEGNAGARCVLGRARAEQDQCDAAVVENLHACPGDHVQRDAIDLALLRCLVKLERWTEADAAWRRLPPELQDQRAVRRQRREIEKGLEDEGRGGAAGSAAESAAASEGNSTSAPEVPGTTGPESKADRPEARAARVTATPVYAPPPGIEEVPAERLAEASTARAVPIAADEPADFGDLPEEDRQTLRRVRDALATEQRQLYAELWKPTRKLAKRHDEFAVAQRLAGSLAFRLGRWKDAIRFLRQDESLVASRPQLQLELAVALHYQGDHEEARQAFELCRPRLTSSAWVEFWAAELKG